MKISLFWELDERYPVSVCTFNNDDVRKVRFATVEAALESIKSEHPEVEMHPCEPSSSAAQSSSVLLYSSDPEVSKRLKEDKELEDYWDRYMEDSYNDHYNHYYWWQE